MADLILEIKQLVKNYHGGGLFKKVCAVNQVSLNLQRGEVYGLLGPNGSGKTTLMKLIVGLLFPSQGSIRVCGQSPQNTAMKKQIGYLPEEAYLYRFLNARETLVFFAQLNGMPKREYLPKIREVLQIVGLDHVRDRQSRFYSKGMSRRLGLAQILLKDPDFIILDEPTIGLDPLGSREIKDIIIDLKQRGKTILLSSHLLSEVEMVCDRIGIIRNGSLLLSGTVEELLQKTHEWTFVLEGLSSDKKDQVEALIKDTFGIRVVSSSRSRETMEDLFIKTIKER